jgi:hypothetical protein
MTLYKTRDFYLSAFLMVKQQKLHKHARYSGSTEFSFVDTPELQELVKKYYAMNITVDPITYSVSIRNLKSLIHSQREREIQLSTLNQELNHEFYNKIGEQQ